VLLRAWADVQKKCDNARLLLVGTGERQLLMDIEQAVGELELVASVRLHLHYVPTEELPDYYSASDIVVYPHQEATTSGALITGMTYGKSIVATALPVFVEALKDTRAPLVPAGDHSSLAEALVELITDQAKRDDLARQISSVQQKQYSWDTIAEQTRQCYEALLRSREAGAQPMKALAEV
jgi:glycosyltransferase involved in cell wall biosynthesis